MTGPALSELAADEEVLDEDSSEWPAELDHQQATSNLEFSSTRNRVEPESAAKADEAAHEPALNWLFVDLNSYFASVEQEVRPELRGRPVAVVPMMADTTVCIAASYEAKAHGVKTGTWWPTPSGCVPDMVLVEARHEIYVDYHHRIVEAVESCLPVTAVLSIDEMACRLMGRERPLLAAMELGRRVKAAHSGAGGPDAAQLGGPGDEPLPGQGGQRHGEARRAGGAAAGHSA